MNNGELDDFLLEGGDELLNSEESPHCGQVLHLDKNINWVDKGQRICKCPYCGDEIKAG